MSKYIDLIKEISAEDRTTMENYIYNYGVKKENFIGLDTWLQNWSHSNQRLFKLLGGKLIHKIDYTYAKNERDLYNEIRDLLTTHPFRKSYHNFYTNYIRPLFKEGKINDAQRAFFNGITDISVFVADKTEYSVKFKKEDAKGTLQLQAGMKPIRAMAKIVKYFPEYFNEEEFEKFRIAHSMILNDKLVKGKLCISIHPMDYITMSDNASDWSSCMNWQNEGCYHIGTVEMMNSNNVVCCYIEASTPFEFGTQEYSGVWNNKKWRILGYVTKDIIMMGKSYPYKSAEISTALLNELRKLAKDNLNWNYSFGPESYMDMIHLNSTYAMDRARDYAYYAKMRPNNFHKHNILWDTQGMYNDMINDHTYPYLCVRNKVDHTKIYSVSGKAPCLCCNKQVIEPTDSGCYNERFDNYGSTICKSCFDKNFLCEICGRHVGYTEHNAAKYDKLENLTVFNDTLNKEITYRVCSHCLNYYFHVCPDCGKLYYNDGNYRNAVLAYYINPEDRNKKEVYSEVDMDLSSYDYFEESVDAKKELKNASLIGCSCCPKCVSKKVDDNILDTISIEPRWGRYTYDTTAFRRNIQKKDIEKYFLFNTVFKNSRKNFEPGYIFHTDGIKTPYARFRLC